VKEPVFQKVPQNGVELCDFPVFSGGSLSDLAKCGKSCKMLWCKEFLTQKQIGADSLKILRSPVRSRLCPFASLEKTMICSKSVKWVGRSRKSISQDFTKRLRTAPEAVPFLARSADFPRVLAARREVNSATRGQFFAATAACNCCSSTATPTSTDTQTQSAGGRHPRRGGLRARSGVGVVSRYGQHEEQAQRPAPWYTTKKTPRFADMLATLRLHLWRSGWETAAPEDHKDLLDWLFNYLATATG
jgi:hypothetical protein